MRFPQRLAPLCVALLVVWPSSGFVVPRQHQQQQQQLNVLQQGGFERRIRRRSPAALKTRRRKVCCIGGATEEEKEEAVTATNKAVEERTLGERVGLFFELAAPYFKETTEAKWGLARVVSLTLMQSGVSVAFSYLSRDFYTALSQRDVDGFQGILINFACALLAGVPVTVLYKFEREKLTLSWRRWMSQRVLTLYTTDRAYYELECLENEIDNPDQRIADDVANFAAVSLSFGITAITSVIDLASFSTILYSIYAPLFGAIIVYAAVGTALTAYAGRDLSSLTFKSLRTEADLRYALVRLRSNAEAIAFYRGEDRELAESRRRLDAAVDAQRDVVDTQRDVEFVSVAYRYLIQILPVAVVAPLYFSKEIELGQVTQSSSAFNHILSDFSLIVNQFESIAAFGAGLDRLGGFFETLGGPLSFSGGVNNNTSSSSSSSSSSSTVFDDRRRLATTPLTMPADVVVRTEGLRVTTPDGRRVLVDDLSFDLKRGERLLLVGASGTGKSSVLRALAGLWPPSAGSVGMPPNARAFFVPQKPYSPLGTLRDQLTYPATTQDDDDVEDNDALLLDLLQQVGLDSWANTSLDTNLDWTTTLSLGEQQRLSFARLLYNEPDLAILDEATSAMDIATERKMYALMQSRLAHTTLISVGHRPSLLEHHDFRLRLGVPAASDDDVLRPISQEDRDTAKSMALL